MAMNDKNCEFCLNRWGCHGTCTRCEVAECGYNHNGHCLDIKALKRPVEQTGCVYYTGKNISDG
ncbi:MAG: hypothetical protein PHO29_11570 [Acetobacterium sp.]|nr:hypothetical protein [Acetobacterium sp.]